MMGTIEIEELRISCIVGILPHERIKEQELIIDIELDLDFSNMERDQNIEDTVDYAELADWLEAWIQKKKFLLLETLAAQTVQQMFSRYPRIENIRLKIRKPAAIPKARAAVVSIVRRR